MTTTSRPCRPRTIARGALARVDRCDTCGCTSVHLGSTTLRLEAAALRSVSETLLQAVADLDADKVVGAWSGSTRGTA